RRLFGNTETNVTQTDIVLTLTPHIIRIPDVTEEDLLPLWIGTEQNIALRGASKSSAFGPTPFEAGEEAPTYPGIPEPTVEEAAPQTGGTLVPVPSAAAPAGAEPPAEDVEAPKPPPSTPAQEKPAAPKPTPTGPALVSLNPSYLTVSLQQPTFTVSVAIRGASGVGSVPFHLGFDPNFLEFVNFSDSSPFLSQDGAHPFVLATLGGGGREVIVGLSRPGNRPGVGDQGTLIDLTFRAKKAGTTTLGFSDLSVLDPAARPLPAQTLGMTVAIQ
ncbi:MAG TPA: cohesin domain-containing protein, partial [Candidatus Polarisedimenticolia bacterium]|nr:cohesin domain-containing protein [Candidatus Polarisedimenticolia bacterium]